MSDCPRCQQDENYGCGCSTLELLNYAQDRVAELEAKLADAYAEALEAAQSHILKTQLGSNEKGNDWVNGNNSGVKGSAHAIRALPNPYKEKE